MAHGVDRFTRVLACTAAAASLFISMTLPGYAQNFPAKPIRIIVPYLPGGPTDGAARAYGAQVAESTGQQVLIENRPGASSVIGMEACAKSPPDGYTLCLAVGDSLSYNPFLFKSLPYDPFKDFAPVINLARGNSLLVASGKAPFNSYKSLVAFAKANPGKLNWGTWGPSSTPDVYLRWINRHESVNIVGVHYKASPPTVAAMLAGEIDITFTAIGFALPQIKAGKLQPIAAVGTRRSSLLPDVPSLADENADPGLTSYFGIFAPARTPRAIVDALNAEFAKAMRTQAVQNFMRSVTLDAVGGSAADFAEFIRNDQATAAKLFKAIGIEPSESPF